MGLKFFKEYIRNNTVWSDVMADGFRFGNTYFPSDAFDSGDYRPTYTYFIWDKERNITKIGRSINPIQRSRGIITQGNITGFMYCYFRNKQEVNSENELHKYFEDIRIPMSEWFNSNVFNIIETILITDSLKILFDGFFIPKELSE